jgi:sulfide:quinone oxidoreductase
MRILIAGGGVAAVEALLALRSNDALDASVEIVAPDPELGLRPLDPAAPYGVGEPVALALAELAAAHDARYHADAVVAVEPAARVVDTAAGERLSYDLLVVAVGARRAWCVLGAVRYTGSGGDEALLDLLERVDAGELREPVLAVPAGFAWPLPAYALAVLTATRAATRGLDVRVAVVTPERAPMAALGAGASARVGSLLRSAGVRVLTGRTASGFEHGRLACAPGAAVPADAAIEIPRLCGPAIAGLPADADGFLAVDRVGRVVGAAGVYAAGDAVVSTIKHGELAARQADVVVDAILADAGLGAEPEPADAGCDGGLFTGLTVHRLSDPACTAEPWAPAVQASGRHLPGLLVAR